MPKVPRITEPTVAPDVVAGANAPRPLQNPLTQFAETGSRVAKQVEQIQHEEQRKVDRIKVLRAQSQALQAENELLDDPEKGAFTLKGENAFGLNTKMMPQLRGRLDEIQQGLDTEDQIQAFQQFRLHREASSEGRLLDHENRQRDAFYTQEEESAAMAGADHVYRHADNPEQVQFGINMQLAALSSRAERNGYSDAVLNEKKGEIVAASHAAVVRAMMDHKRYAEAEKYAADHDGEIAQSSKVHDDLKSALKIAKKQDEAERRQAIIWARQDREYAQAAKYEELSKRKFRGEIISTTELESLDANYRAALLREDKPAFDVDYYGQILNMAATKDPRLLDIELSSLVARGFSEARIVEVSKLKAAMLEGKDAGSAITTREQDISDLQRTLKTLYSDKDDAVALGVMMDEGIRRLDDARDPKTGKIDFNLRREVMAEVYATAATQRRTVRGDKIGEIPDEDAWTGDQIPTKDLIPRANIPPSFVNKVERLAVEFNYPSGLSEDEIRELYTRSLIHKDETALRNMVMGMIQPGVERE